MRGDGLGVVHEGVDGEAEMIDKFLAALGKEVSEVVSLEAQPEAFDGIEVRAVSREELRLKIMPVQTFGLVPAGVIQNEQPAFVRGLGNALSQVIQVALEDIGIHAVKNHGEAFARGRANSSDDIGSHMITRIRNLGT